jgi:hypothetical protein
VPGGSLCSLQVVRRALEILLNIGSFGLNLLGDRQRGRLDPRTMTLRARQLRGRLTQLGPTFVKVTNAGETRSRRTGDLCLAWQQ